MKNKGNMIEKKLAGAAPGAGQAAPAERDAEFDRLVNELYELTREGALPEGFDLEAACRDAGFVELVGEFGAKAGIRIWAAEKRAEEAESSAMQRLNSRVQQRRGLPRPLNGGGFASARPDYANMDSETFRKLSEQMRISARNGKRVPL
ncbi:MAG: hypothetical protein Q4C13_05640 [Clostridia bacterium]|nr:hypothetical protein [Clostridia bacterium]